jgi:hypothetical protein
MEENKIRLVTQITGEERGLKTFIAKFMAFMNISCAVERVRGENGYFTGVEIEAVESLVHAGKIALIAALKDKFP